MGTIRSLRHRRKAPFGSETAAILASAAMTTAASLAGAKIGADASKDAANRQAESIRDQANKQAQAIKEQNENNSQLQEKSLAFTKQENAENRELQKDIQTSLQILTGQQNLNDRLEASKIVVKNGGSTRRRLRNSGQSSLRGGNMPFVVTDGGGVIPVGTTPEGYDLYEIVGNDHEHYHKTKQGKAKTGVGIKFADGSTVEGEGNQNGNQGEYLLDTPDNAYFISRHTIGGINPAKMINRGMHPLKAYGIQEYIKSIKGISDDGKHNKKKLMGGTPNYAIDMYNINGPQLGVDTIGDAAVGSAYAYNNKFKLGGRTKALNGLNLWNVLNLNKRISNAASGARSINNALSRAINGNSGVGAIVETNNTPRQNNDKAINVERISPEMFSHAPYNSVNVNNNINNINNNANTKQPSLLNRIGSFVDKNANTIAGGINALGNIGGALISANAARKSADIVADASTYGAKQMSDAYRSLKTIDMSNLSRKDYAAAHMMPALQAPVSFAATNMAISDRKLQRRLRNAGRNSASSAIAQARMANAEIESQDEKNRINNADRQQMQAVRQQNVNSINEASKINAALDNEANDRYTADYMNLLKYNNDIENNKILGSAGALSEGAVNSANAIAQGRIASGQSWANALTNTGLTFSNTLSSMAKRRADLDNTMLGATTDAQINYIAKNGSLDEKETRRKAIRAAIDSGKLSNEDIAKYKYYESLLS